MSSQSDVIAFLSSPAAFPDDGPVEVIETHGAYVFLCGDVALKLKRAVHYDYMDLSTVALRRDMLRREIELNAPFAPMIYRDVLPVTREDDGLAFEGKGSTVDWVLRMWRFPARNELEEVVKRGALDDTLASDMGEVVARYHDAVPIIRRPGAHLIGEILDELERVFAEFSGWAGTQRVTSWLTDVRTALERNRTLLDRRGQSGHVRRAHGDLHLRNIVLIDRQPTLFDALEFDETLGTCDVLYDIAFLIMDLCHRGLQQQACRVLDAWLREAKGQEDAGLAALPLFLSVRAAIRAMVLLQTDAARHKPGASAGEIAEYIELACASLQKQRAVLVAVGGYSAVGKSAVARRVAPKLGAIPGAVILSSDLERKAGFEKAKFLGTRAYSSDRRTDVYRGMFGRAKMLLNAGHSVLLDATFLDPRMREEAAKVADQAGVAFCGVWLKASQAILEKRITARRKGPSDADIVVLRQQLLVALGNLDWRAIDANGSLESVQAAMEDVLDRFQSKVQDDADDNVGRPARS